MCSSISKLAPTLGTVLLKDLRTNLKLKYNIKSPNYIQQNYSFQASFLFFWTMSFTCYYVIKIGNDCVTLHFALVLHL